MSNCTRVERRSAETRLAPCARGDSTLATKLKPASRCSTLSSAAWNAGIVDRAAPAALYEDLLAGMVGEPFCDDLVGAPALAGSEVLFALIVGARGGADDHGGHHEREPAEDREPAVAGAPPTGPGCDVALLRHDRSFASYCGSVQPDRTPAAVRIRRTTEAEPQQLRDFARVRGYYGLPVSGTRGCAARRAAQRWTR